MPSAAGDRFRDSISLDVDEREAVLRELVGDALAVAPPPELQDAIVATYFLALRSRSLPDAADEIAYHATSGSHHPTPGGLVAACTGWSAGVVPFDETGRVGLLHMAFPLRMLLQADGHLTTTDILHTAAGAAIFDMYDNQDSRLVRLTIPSEVIRTFPGPAHGPAGFRRLVGLVDGEPAFGTILKPTAGLLPDDVASLVGKIAQVPLLSFVKEDEDLYPNLPYSPVADRTQRALAAIARERAGRAATLLFAPHVTAAPGEIIATVDRVLDQGARAVMFSESWALGTVRMVREHTASAPVPPAIYGHNAGIGVRTRGIWREVIDFLARLDGIDFRQTAPLRPGAPHLRPYGAEWRASEDALTRPLPGIGPTTVVRAGGLDQGNIGLNLQDVEERGLGGVVLFLAGSAITSIEDEAGRPDPALGAAAMADAIDLHRAGELRSVPAEDHPRILLELARGRGLVALARALPQRYPELV
jgi:ribulose-bisphosphate carboxylase large chain